MNIFDFLSKLLDAQVETLILVAGLALIFACLINVPPIPNSDNRKKAFLLGLFLFALGLILHLLPPNIFSITENKTPSTTTSPDQPASSQKTNPRYKHTLKTFGKYEGEKTYKSIFFSTEKVFVEFDFNAPDLADYEKRIRVDKAGTDLIEVKPFLFNKKVSNLGEIDIGTFEPGSYIVGGVFRRNIKSTEGLVEESFDVKRS